MKLLPLQHLYSEIGTEMQKEKRRMSDSYVRVIFFHIYFVYEGRVWPGYSSHNVFGPLSYCVSGETTAIVSALLLGYKCANLSPSQWSKPPESWHRAERFAVTGRLAAAADFAQERKKSLTMTKIIPEMGALTKKKRNRHDDSALSTSHLSVLCAGSTCPRSLVATS